MRADFVAPPVERDLSLTFGLVSHMNPTVLYLCQEIERADASFNAFLGHASEKTLLLKDELRAATQETEQLLKLKKTIMGLRE